MERAKEKFETIINVKEAKIPIFIGNKGLEQSMKIIQTPFLLWLDKMCFGKNIKYTLITHRGVLFYLLS